MKYLFILIATLIFAANGDLSASDAEQISEPKPHPFGKREQVVQQINGQYEPVSLPAEIQWISEPWYRESKDENAQMPYLAYLAEKDRVVMLVITHHPTHTAFIFSDDRGKTWSQRRWLSTDGEGHPKPGIALGLTNLGGGKLVVHPDNVTHGRWVSNSSESRPWSVMTTEERGIKSTAMSWQLGSETFTEHPLGFVACNLHPRYCYQMGRC